LEALLRICCKDAARSGLCARARLHPDEAWRRPRRALGGGIEPTAIHINKSQPQSERALAGFRDGQARVLITTDIAARGIDIDGVSHVINFELPNVAEDYVHRVCRTARAAAGIAIAFCSDEERPYLHNIEKLTRCSLRAIPVPLSDSRLAQLPDRAAGGSNLAGNIRPSVEAEFRKTAEPPRRNTRGGLLPMATSGAVKRLRSLRFRPTCTAGRRPNPVRQVDARHPRRLPRRSIP
jgi:superfamily II DNA/RNA helicase